MLADNKLNVELVSMLFAKTCRKIPESLLTLIARFAIAAVFWRSVQTKITGDEILGQKWQFYQLSDSTFTLFEYEYDLPLLSYELAAYLATFTEFFLSILIFIGLFTRVSAIGLLVITAVIQVLVYPDAWPTHILWASALLYIIKNGAGKLSCDYLYQSR